MPRVDCDFGYVIPSQIPAMSSYKYEWLFWREEAGRMQQEAIPSYTLKTLIYQVHPVISWNNEVLVSPRGILAYSLQNANAMIPASRLAVSYISFIVGSALAATLPAAQDHEPPATVTTLDELHAIAVDFPDSMLVWKDGSYVFEVDGSIKVTTGEALTVELDKISESLPADEEGEGESQSEVDQTPASEILPARRCSNPRCFYSSLCLSYSDCHVCLGPRPSQMIRGSCI